MKWKTDLLILFWTLSATVWTCGAPVDAGLERKLTHTNDATRLAAFKQLIKAVEQDRSLLPTVEKYLAHSDGGARLDAARALVIIVGPEQAAKKFGEIFTDSEDVKIRRNALFGLEECGVAALPTLKIALNDKSEYLVDVAVLTAAKADKEGALKDKIIPLYRQKKLEKSVMKYMLAQGCREFRKENGKWPIDFAEASVFIRKKNPLADLTELSKGDPIWNEFEEDKSDGSLRVGVYFKLNSDGTGHPKSRGISDFK